MTDIPPAARRRRSERPRRGAGRLTDRDLELLTFVGRCRAVTTDAVAAVFFGDRSTASRRLARLVGAGMLSVHVEHLNAPNWYTLSERAAEHLVAEGVEEGALFTGRLPRRETLEHLRRLNEFRAALVLGCRARPDVSVGLFLADHDLRRIAGLQVPEYVPDAVVELTRAGRAPLGLLVEVDLGHESAAYVARTKGRTTLEANRARAPLWGLARWRPILVAPSAARLRSLARALVGVGVGDLWIGTTFEALQTSGVLGPAFLTLAEVAATAPGTPLPFRLRLAPEPDGGAS